MVGTYIEIDKSQGGVLGSQQASGNLKSLRKVAVTQKIYERK